MAASAGRQCCHLLGIAVSVLTLVLGIAGLVLLCVYPGEHRGHWVGVGLMVGAAAAAILTLVYSCYTLHSHWKLWGCLDVSTPNSRLHDELRARRSHIEIPESSESGGPEDGGSSREGVSSKDMDQTSRPLDWDPEAVLPDKDLPQRL